MRCLFFVDRLHSLFSLRIRIVSFATESVVILKQEHLQVNVLSNENCFEEIGLKVAPSSLFGLKE